MKRTRRVLACVLLGLLTLGLSVPANASHFRYGNNSWKPGSGPTDIDLQVSEAWRRSAYSGSGSDGFPVPGDLIFSNNTIAFGDTSATSFELLVTSIDVTNDWLFGVALDPNRPAGNTSDTLIGHTYPATGNFTMSTDGCCRVGQTSVNWHVNNPDGSQRVESIVNVGSTNSSPVSTLPPIVQCPINGLCSFSVPASDPNGDQLRFRLSTAAEAGGAFNQPGPPFAPNAATVNASTGVYSWDTTGATLAGVAGANTLYSTQVTVEDLNGAGAVKSKTAVDFVIQLVTTVGTPPVFNHPPTPLCGTTINTSPGSPVAFTVQASDADAGDTVTLTAAGLPAGATHTPGLPTTGNPVSSAFSWTPSVAQTGTHVVTYSATDSGGQQALCGITIVVGSTTSPQLSIGNGKVFEGDAGRRIVRFPVTLSPSSTSPVTVDYTTTDGLGRFRAQAPLDYTARAGTLTFPAGSTSQQVSVTLNGNTINEGTEYFKVKLSNPQGATLHDASGTGVIVGDDPGAAAAHLDVGSASVYEGEAGSSVQVMVTLSKASASAVSVHFATANGSATAPGDYTASSGNLTFSPGQTTKAVTVAIAGDTTAEGTETFTVQLSAASGAAISHATGTVKILNGI